MSTQLAFPLDKRWIHRREAWRAPGETIRPDDFGVDVIRQESVSRRFVVEHHYSGSFPAARLSVGLFRKTGPARKELVGVAVFSVPMQGAAITRYSGLEPGSGVELGRFVLMPEVAFNGETWFLRRALSALRAEKPDVRVVLSYSDPMERRTAEGLLTKPAHVGQIYQAHNAVFAGRASPHWHWFTRDGQVVSPRALSKIRNQERGHAYAERLLIAAGAGARGFLESPADWLDRVLEPPAFRRLRHPGNFAYVFGLDREAKAAVAAVNGGGLPYPHLQRPRSA